MPVETAAGAQSRVLTIVGSTTLPPLEDVSRAPAESALLIETPSF
jgi:hypothetical protein